MGIRIACAPRMRFLTLSIILGTGALAGCAEGGALGQSSVSQACAASDAQCHLKGLDAPVAVGATQPLDINIEIKGSSAPPITLLSANEEVFTVSGQTMTGTGPGVASLLVTSEKSVVLDFIHLWVQTATGLALTRRAEDGSVIGDMPGKIQLLAGDEIRVSAAALSSTQPLLGTPPATWSADANVVSLLDEGVPGRVRVVAHAAGKTTVTCAALDLTQSFDVEVMP